MIYTINYNSLIEEAQKDNITKLVVGAVIANIEGKVLTVVRATDEEDYANLREIPSGTVDAGESMDDALVREVYEETGLKVKEIMQYLGSFDYISGSGKNTRQFNFLVKIEDSSSVSLNPKEHQSYLWLSDQEFDKFSGECSKETTKIIKSIFLLGMKLQNMETHIMNHMSRSVAQLSLDTYNPIYQEEREFLIEMKEFLNEYEIFAHRSNLVGHFTGSAWVLNPSHTHVLLIHHVKLNKWFQPGGHTEYGDTSFKAASMREAEEEIGISGFYPISENIYDIDIHTIPEKNGEPEHKHYDVRYVLVLDNMDTSKIDTVEVHGAKWVDIDELLQDDTISRSIRRMAEKTRQLKLSRSIKESQKNILGE